MRPPAAPSLGRSVTRQSARARNLERRFVLGGGAPRMVCGCVYNDGGTDEGGSGDWECSWDSVNGYTFTVSPAFTAAIKVVVFGASNNNAAGDAGSPAPYFVGLDVSLSLLDTFVAYTWDAIGDPDSGGFAFVAIDQAVA